MLLFVFGSRCCCCRCCCCLVVDRKIAARLVYVSCSDCAAARRRPIRFNNSKRLLSCCLALARWCQHLLTVADLRLSAPSICVPSISLSCSVWSFGVSGIIIRQFPCARACFSQLRSDCCCCCLSDCRRYWCCTCDVHHLLAAANSCRDNLPRAVCVWLLVFWILMSAADWATLGPLAAIVNKGAASRQRARKCCFGRRRRLFALR